MENKNVNINFDLSSFEKLFNSLAERLGHMTGTDIAFLILALMMPPVAVLLKVGFTAQFWVNVLLTVLGYIPGQIHAIWVVLF